MIGPVVDEQQLAQDLELYRYRPQGRCRTCLGRRTCSIATPRATICRRPCSSDTRNEMRINREEIFGPVASVIKVDSYEEALATANDTSFGLSSGIFTTSLKAASHFRKNTAAGLAMVNLATAGRRLSRAVRRPQRLKLWRARARPSGGRILHDDQDRLYARRIKSALSSRYG